MARLRRAIVRSKRGAYLIELLVALAISGFLAVALAASLSEQMRVTTGAENQVKAAEVAQQVIDRIRESNQTLPHGIYPIQLDSDDGVGIGTQWFQKRPLNYDLNSFSYPNMIGADSSQPADQFVGPGLNGRATVTAVLAPSTPATTSLLTVTVTWSEGTATRSAVFSTTISKTPNSSQPGIHL